eukprot:g2403.t1
MFSSQILFTFALLASLVNADIYMHNPPGSNDRNRERNENRNNGNRLFDSQNNDKGGYPWRGDRMVRGVPDPAEYYEGSLLNLEWTAQHGCGDNPSTNCAFIIQYGCSDTLPGLRDGYPSGALEDSDSDNDNNNYDPPYQQASFDDNNNDGTNQISANTQNNIEYGQHEDNAWYQTCQNTQRNQGLYTADQDLNNDDATSTRQNPNGNRSGFECPEERDYYPYWLQTPWRDVAVLTSNTDWCEYYQANSGNVKTGYRCVGGGGNAAITEAGCQGAWTAFTQTVTGVPPDCQMSPSSRQNHLGNSSPIPNDNEAIESVDLGGGTAAHYEWSVPEITTFPGDAESIDCVLRYRYNISTQDYPSFAGMTEDGGEFVDSDYNCPDNANDDDNDPNATTEQLGCQNRLTDGNRPLYNRPFVQVFEDADVAVPKIAIALNTDQSGRVFQDRSHVFRIRKRPSGAEGETIWNVNTRGRRGNIVQAYPAVEYGLHPAELTVSQGDLLHIQLHGSDFNANRNPNNGEGWRYSDRSNLVEVEDLAQGIPLPFNKMNFFSDSEQAREFALLDSESNLIQAGSACEEFDDNTNNEDNDPQNCGKMNYASARWQPSINTDDGPGLIEVQNDRQTFNFVSTRNNNFSNRSNKWTLHVTGLKWWEILLIVLGILAFIGLVNAAFIYFLKKNDYDVCLGYQYFCCPCCRSRLDVETIDDISVAAGSRKGKSKSKSKSSKRSSQTGKSSKTSGSGSSKKSSSKGGGNSQGRSEGGKSRKSKKPGETELMGF